MPLERNGDTIVLAGIDDPNGYTDQKTPEELAAEVYAACGDPFWILLAHRNNRFARQYSLLGADLVCSGHAHGGIVRLPGTDGLFSHDLDLFPSYTAGLYEENGSVLFVTRGLGNSGPSFRVFNRPEIAVLTLRRAEGKALAKAEQPIAPDRILPQILRPLVRLRTGDPGEEEFFHGIRYFLHDKSPFKKYSYMCYH